MVGELIVDRRIVIPAWAIEMQTSRSSGPGGQNVNKVASRVQLWIEWRAAKGLAPGEEERLRAGLAPRLDTDGRLMVSSQATRDQHRNLEDALAKAADLIRRALAPSKVRRPTKPTKASKQRRLEEKRRRSRQLRERRAEGES